MIRLPHIAAFMSAGFLALASCGRTPDVSSAVAVNAAPRIEPDYTETVIPPNIAPLNFRVKEEGSDCVVRISSDVGPSIEMHCPDLQCRVDQQAWRELLLKNKGRQLHYDVFVRKADGAWTRFRRFSNTVAEEPIDSYIVYRQLAPNDHFATIKGIYQRNLETFESSRIISLRRGTFECFNCHTFCQNDPNRFLFHIRGKGAGMMLVINGQFRKIDTQQPPLWRPLAYASWHPDGVHIAATLNQFRAVHLATEKLFRFQAVEKRGNLVVYNVETNALSTTRPVFENDFIETHPCWSPDGKYIYYVRGRDMPILSFKDFDNFLFDLMRISYDTATDVWGEPELVLECSKLHRCCSFPRPSPDGRYILHIEADKSTYPIHQKSSDLYVYDLKTKEDRKLEAASSDMSESFPRWSLNGRWFSFTSTRRDGLRALPHFAYFDAQGHDHKAFLLPQEDPAYYDAFTDSYNVVELVKSKVTVDPFKLAEAMEQPAEPATFPHAPHVDAYTGATRIAR